MKVWIGRDDDFIREAEFVGTLKIGDEVMVVVRTEGMALRALPPTLVSMERPGSESE